MDTSQHDLEGLFQQLGLPTETHDIRAFVASHPLPHNISIEDAPFWTASQSAFLKQSLDNDAEWSAAVDRLASLLTA